MAFFLRRQIGKILITAAAAFCAATVCYGADNVIIGSGGGSYGIKTKTLLDYRFRETIRQQRDFSCGSAALATLLHYHYGRPITETQALQAMYEVGDQEKIRKEGFSLLDMKKYLVSIGLQSEGYRVSLDKLNEVGIPAIALLNIKGYLHFVLVRGIRDGKVLVADPALGMKAHDRDDFEKMWNGIFFVVVNDKETGQKHFNLAKHWGRSLQDHNLQQVVARDNLGTFTLYLTPSPGYF